MLASDAVAQGMLASDAVAQGMLASDAVAQNTIGSRIEAFDELGPCLALKVDRDGLRRDGYDARGGDECRSMKLLAAV